MVLARAGRANDYDLALNLGVCGSFDRALAPGAVVHVVSDRLAELGAEDGDAFLTIQELHLLGDDEFPFTAAGWSMRHRRCNRGARAASAPSSGITVNTVHGNERLDRRA